MYSLLVLQDGIEQLPILFEFDALQEKLASLNRNKQRFRHDTTDQNYTNAHIISVQVGLIYDEINICMNCLVSEIQFKNRWFNR